MVVLSRPARRPTPTTAPAEPAPSRLPRWTPLRVFWAAFAAFFVIGVGWGLAMPYDGFADEARHSVRAWSAAGGELVFHGHTDRTGTPLVRAPKSLAPNAPANSACFHWHPNRSAACSPPPGRAADQHKMVSLSTGAGRYNPLYYLIVGQPLRLWPDMTGIYLARMISNAMCSALLAASVAATALAPRGRRLLSGLLVALTPVAVHLSAAINPAGIEIAGAMALWSALVLLVDGRVRSRWLVRIAGIGAAVVATVRFGGVLWLVLIGLTAVLGLEWSVVRELTRSRVLRRWGAFVAAATVAGVVWSLWQNPAGDAVGATRGHSSLLRMVYNTVNIDTWDRGEYFLKGMVGLVGFGDFSPPALLFPVWFCVFGVVVFGALAFGRWRDRLRLIVLVAGTFAILWAGDVTPISQGWYLSQGRYALPAVLGVPLLGAWLLAQRGVLTESSLARLTRAYVVVLLPLQFLTLYSTMLRYQHGIKSGNPLPVQPANPFTGAWLPPLGPGLPLTAAVLGLAFLGAIFWWGARVEERSVTVG